MDALSATFDPERYRVQEAILAEPPTDMRDLAIKLLVNNLDGSGAMDDELIARLAGRDFDKLPGLSVRKGRAGRLMADHPWQTEQQTFGDGACVA